jgi:hypothetical protein
VVFQRLLKHLLVLVTVFAVHQSFGIFATEHGVTFAAHQVLIARYERLEAIAVLAEDFAFCGCRCHSSSHGDAVYTLTSDKQQLSGTAPDLSWTGWTLRRKTRPLFGSSRIRGPYLEQVRDRLRKMTDAELLWWGREAARLVRMGNKASTTALHEPRAEWRRRHPRKLTQCVTGT